MQCFGAFLVLSLASATFAFQPQEDLLAIARPRLVGGQLAKAGQFPWQVAIYFDTNNGTSFCGGALISAKWILTAGHCVYRAKVFTLRLGTLSLLKSEPTRVVVGATHSVIHPSFNQSTLDNNIGLIRIDVPYKTNERIKILELAPSVPIANGSNITISGWGTTGNWDGVNPELNFLNLQVIPNAECERYYGKWITDNVICVAGKNQEGTCSGDIGGAITVLDPAKKSVAVSIVSMGSAKGCDTRYPSAHVKIAPHIEWILSQIKD